MWFAGEPSRGCGDFYGLAAHGDGPRELAVGAAGDAAGGPGGGLPELEGRQPEFFFFFILQIFKNILSIQKIANLYHRC